MNIALRLSFAGVVVLAASTVGCSVVYTPAADGTQGANEPKRFETYQDRRHDAEAAKVAEWAPKQKAFDTAFAAEIAEFQALSPSLAKTDDASADLATKADDLRARFVKRCVAESGWSTV